MPGPGWRSALDELQAALAEPESIVRRLPRNSRSSSSPSPSPSRSPLRCSRRGARESSRGNGATTARTPRGPSGVFVDAVSRHVDADLADLVSRITTGLWRRLQRRPATGTTSSDRHSARQSPPPCSASDCSGRAGGVGWTRRRADADGEQDAHRRTPRAADPTASGSPPRASASPSATPVGDTDLASVASRLLTQRSACAGDAGCLAARARGSRQGSIPAGSRGPARGSAHGDPARRLRGRRRASRRGRSHRAAVLSSSCSFAQTNDGCSAMCMTSRSSHSRSDAEVRLELGGLETGLDGAEEAGRIRTVDHAVVVRQCEVDVRADGDRILALDGDQSGSLDDGARCRGSPTAAGRPPGCRTGRRASRCS